jgi:hypothetical protein
MLQQQHMRSRSSHNHQQGAALPMAKLDELGNAQKTQKYKSLQEMPG